ncbi:glycosyltransferase family 4 protein [Sphingobacterium phlebotomi]|uniref:Glycosyltransferase family 4 protein n=1 Tax=Sphingobacterium phlebotomi TaxID=2605433 RepID=A0A5D4H984_9SPHI|nr:glycosyltransferase [Sphingobacterium phlebotomi]TYR36842.1 glycosyltransferase family 4 protein [Sphingobacterium phlebotomi]
MAKRLIYVGFNGFPRASAEVVKQKLICKTFQLMGFECTIICNKNYFFGNYRYRGTIEGISYFYSTFLYSKTKSKIFNKLIQIFGVCVEKLYLIYKPTDVAIISSRNFWAISIYALIFKIKRTKTLLTHVEDVSSVGKKSVGKKWNDYLFNHYAFRLVDGALPISEYLKNKISNFAPETLQLKLPVMVDYNSFKLKEIRDEFTVGISFNYFLYCGSVSYKEVLNFIVDSFKAVGSSYKLVLILNGQPEKLKIIRNELKEYKNIIIYSEISFQHLIYLYNNAKGLLIPLRETVQDKARFPHKIGEYTASGNPIITNNWGEVKNLFTNKVNAFVCERYDVELFTAAMRFIIDNPKESKSIGLNGEKMAKDVFNYPNYVEPLSNLIKSIT